MNSRIESRENNDKEKINIQNNYVDMEALLTSLKKEDQRVFRMMRNFKWFLLGMVILYTGLMVVNPDPELSLHHRVSGLCYVAAFALFALLFRKYDREFGKIDYALPSSEMLQRAAKRYDLTLTRYLYVLPSLVLIDIGLTVSEFFRWTHMEPVLRILLVQAFYIPLLMVSGLIGYLIWRRKQKPLHDGALKLLEELRGE